MRKKRFMLATLALMLILPAFLVHANPPSSSFVEKIEADKLEGEVASKDEVVYANLSANGTLKEIYVVNILDVTKAGMTADYGKYSSVKNLTDLSELKHLDEMVMIDAPMGKFYYQGNMEDAGQLPWDINVSYLLDGTEIAPTDLAGKNGFVEMNITTSGNGKAHHEFFENYLLQVSLTLDPETFKNIETNEGMVVNVGKNKQITFSVMPNRTSELIVQADVEDFELQGIEIAAIPMTMSIDTPDVDEMTEDIDSLASAIRQLNKGVAEFKSGVKELNDGVASLRNGSEQYKSGMTTIDRTSSELVNGSASISEALTKISGSLQSNSSEMDVSELKTLPEGLSQIAKGLNETAEGLSTLRDNYSLAFKTLDRAMSAIPDNGVSEEEMQRLYMSGADKEVLDKLVETYSAARSAKGTYAAVKEGFLAVETNLPVISGHIKEMSSTLTSVASGLSSSLENMDGLNSLAQLQDGLTTLSTNYREFHSGLVSYTQGISQLSNSYNELHDGIVELTGGTARLADGGEELHNGTEKLYEATRDLPVQMQEEVDNMIADYDRSDFEAVSFVSAENEKVNSVQFVIKTESIKKEEELKTTEEHIEEEQGLWTRLLKLFSRG